MGITLGTLVVAGVLHASGVLSESRKVLSHGLYHEREIGEDIVIVAMDDKSRADPEEGGLGSKTFWPRTYYGDVIEEIEKGSPALVMLDVLLTSESSSITEGNLEEIVKDYPNVTAFTEKMLEFVGTPHPHDSEFAATLETYENIYLVKGYYGKPEWTGEAFEVESEVLPLNLFNEVAKTGYYNMIEGEEGENLSTVYYSIPTKIAVDGIVDEHIDLKLARDYLGADEALDVPTEKGQMLINYAKEPYGYPMFSFSDVYYGKVDPAYFEGKIVLIGATANIFQDNWATPIDQKRLMPGIEIHANAIQTILDEEYLRYQSTGGFLALAGLIILGTVAVVLFAPILAGSAFVVAEIAAFPFYAQWSFGRGTIVDLIWPVFAMAVAYLAVLVYRNFTEFAEKRKLKTAFSRYVSKDLAEQITEKPELLQLGGERRNITALFLDIENFTNLSEGLQPQEVVRIINVYFDALAHVIMAHEGSVDKYEGDAIMALWGAPVASTDHAVKACKAALAIQARMAELNKAMGYNLNIRVGLASGDAIVGNMGSAERFDYTAMGDTVNTASRLEGANKFYKTKILVNPGTKEAVDSAGGALVFRQVDTVCLKGKDNAIGIYEVMGLSEGASEDGKKLVEEWHAALEHYKAGNWGAAESGMKAVLAKLPEDGPAKTLLGRMAELKLLPKSEGWDGVWRFESK